MKKIAFSLFYLFLFVNCRESEDNKETTATDIGPAVMNLEKTETPNTLSKCIEDSFFSLKGTSYEKSKWPLFDEKTGVYIGKKGNKLTATSFKCHGGSGPDQAMCHNVLIDDIEKKYFVIIIGGFAGERYLGPFPLEKKCESLMNR